MASIDPIAPVVQALSVLVKPKPASIGAGSKPSDWESQDAIPGPSYSAIQGLLNLLFHVSTDMTTVSKGVNTALTDVAKVVTTIADNLSSAGNLTDVTNAMTALQNSLSLAQALAPGSSTTVLNSASGLFQQLQNLLSAPGQTVANAAAELAEFSQQLTALAGLFPTS